MKLIWLTNCILPVVSERLGEKISYVNGWTDLLSRKLLSQKNYELVSVYPDSRLRSSIFGKRNRLKWYGFHAPKVASINYNEKRVKYFREILEIEKPDLVHIWGTEYSHCTEMTEAASGLVPVVISIQGIISECAKVYLQGIPKAEINRQTFHDIVRNDGLKMQKYRFEMRGKLEKRALRQVKYVIGRTKWDKDTVQRINSDIRYFKCDEIMRDCFYSEKAWSYSNCEKNSIFLPQSYYPIKGMHIALKILSGVKRYYPDVHLYTTGRDARCRSLSDRLRQNSYERFVSELIREYDLDENVTYLGSLNAEGMKKMYMKANVFLQASIIENSSNSLTEAMLIGTPIVVSNVGGTESIVPDEVQDQLYDVRDVEKAVNLILEMFSKEADDCFDEYRKARDMLLEAKAVGVVSKQYENCYNVIANNETFNPIGS